MWTMGLRSAFASSIALKPHPIHQSSRTSSAQVVLQLLDRVNVFFFFGRRRLKKRSEKTEIARPKRKHRKRKREGASVREDSQPPPPGLETCSSSRRKSSHAWGTNNTRISRNFGGDSSRDIEGIPRKKSTLAATRAARFGNLRTSA